MADIQSKLNGLFKDLNIYLNEKKLLSRFELRLKIKELIGTNEFSEDELQHCETCYEYPLLQYIFLSATSGIPSSIYAPILHEKLEYKQILFYHSHTFKTSEDLLEQAYKEACQLKLKYLQTLVSKILLKANYSVIETSLKRILATLEGVKLNCSLFCSLLELTSKLSSLDLTPNDALIIPPGTNAAPFIQFYQQFSNQILLAEATVWLIDPETETVSIFIGIPSKRLLGFFTKSQLARSIERRWRPTITEDF